MTFIAAAEAILRSARRPLTTRELTEAAIKRGLVTTTGQTPLRTMGAALYKALNKSDVPRIRRDFVPGPKRAISGSVRWMLDKQ
jgi:hypothetical protein